MENKKSYLFKDLTKGKDQNNQSTTNDKDKRTCPRCNKAFEQEYLFEMHYNHCNENSNVNIGDNLLDTHNKNNSIPHNDSIYDRYIDDYINYKDDYIDPYYYNDYIESTYQQENFDNYPVDIEMNYETLLQLDENNIAHPLGKEYLSILPNNRLTSEVFYSLTDEDKRCSICFDDFVIGQQYIRLPCFHIFHSDEIESWLRSNKTCPICRIDIEEILK
jgi:hypothetical protein